MVADRRCGPDGSGRSRAGGPDRPVVEALPEGRSVTVVVEGVSKVFPGKGSDEVTALSDIDLTVGDGEFVSLIGPSGCGKSTLLRLIADLDSPTGGTLTVFDKTPRQARLDQDYGIAFQQAGLLPWRSVRANVELPLQLHKVAGRKERVNELLEMVGLSDFADRYPDELSGGMQQRVAIARAFAEKPKLLLMDEPFGALDEMTRERMQGELVRLASESGAAVIFVTHSIPEAVFLSDRVVVMSPRPGRIREILSVDLGRGVDRGEGLREDTSFFERVSAVREALHGGAPTGVRGVETR
ncbi:ABC transporter ATP-binding protein [Branchiibius hedensis]|uniref:ABC transporter ATP-binding protein n=1 Tax=Branchiibius hedensis TaxID=672460 RepID=UPI000D6D57DA